ncbi:MAG: CPBP family intramembrane glutamic endopeptidase [Verrucomicrobiota bacterium]
MNDNPLLLLAVFAAGLYVAGLWWRDLRAARAGRPNPRALPGAVPATAQAGVIAAAGAVGITLLETWGESRLGLSQTQSKMTVLFGVYTLMAAFIEELVFRGFIVIEGRGAAAQWTGALGASVLFAALHPFLWSWNHGEAFRLNFTAKGWFSTGAVFTSSLWFYVMRFAARLNPRGSLLPCFAAHGAKNLAVIAIKSAQGFIVGLW